MTIQLEPQMRALRAWHLAMLRFALTFDDNDRLNVIAIANEIDRLGRQHADRSGFRFFCKTSVELCAAILRRNESADAILRLYVARIDDAKLKRAFMAALTLDNPTPAVNETKKQIGLWHGLSPRRDIRPRAP